MTREQQIEMIKTREKRAHALAQRVMSDPEARAMIGRAAKAAPKEQEYTRTKVRVSA